VFSPFPGCWKVLAAGGLGKWQGLMIG